MRHSSAYSLWWVTAGDGLEKKKNDIPLLTLSLPLHDHFNIQKTRAKVLSTIKKLLLAVFVVLYFCLFCLCLHIIPRGRGYTAQRTRVLTVLHWCSNGKCQRRRCSSSDVQLQRSISRSASSDRGRLKMIAQSYAEMSANAGTWRFIEIKFRKRDNEQIKCVNVALTCITFVLAYRNWIIMFLLFSCCCFAENIFFQILCNNKSNYSRIWRNCNQFTSCTRTADVTYRNAVRLSRNSFDVFFYLA